MRMSRRAGLLYVNRLPSLGELLASHRSTATYSYAGNTKSTSYLQLNPNNIASVGEACYSFIFTGGSLAISRVDIGEQYSIAVTELANCTEPGVTPAEPYVYQDISQNQYLQNKNSVYGTHLLVKFDAEYAADQIDEIIRGTSIECLKYYYSSNPSSYSQADDATRYPMADMPATGYLFAVFPINTNNNAACFSLSECATPLTRLWSVTQSVGRSYAALIQRTVDSVDYLFPSANNADIASTRSYSLFALV